MGSQCPKSLWIKYNKPEAFINDNSNERVFANGHLVGECAQELFPFGVLIDFDKNIENMAKKTAELIANGETII